MLDKLQAKQRVEQTRLQKRWRPNGHIVALFSVPWM